MSPSPGFQSFLDGLEGQIAELPLRNQVAFAASCCERAIPNYQAFSEAEKWGDAEFLRNCLDRVWSFIEGEPLSSEEAKTLEAKCKAITPNSDDFSSDYVDAAQEAAFMVTLLLQWVGDQNPHYAVRIATFCRDTVDLHVQVLESLNPSDPDLEDKIARHPLMSAELAKQSQDLGTLAKIKTRDELKKFRATTRQTGGSNIGI